MSKPIDSGALVRSYHDHVRMKRSGMREDDSGGITLLSPVLEPDIRQIGPPPKLRGQCEAFTGVPAKRLIQGYRLYNDELGGVPLTESERVLESTTRRLGEIDRRENTSDRSDDTASRARN